MQPANTIDHKSHNSECAVLVQGTKNNNVKLYLWIRAMSRQWATQHQMAGSHFGAILRTRQWLRNTPSIITFNIKMNPQFKRIRRFWSKRSTCLTSPTEDSRHLPLTQTCSSMHWLSLKLCSDMKMQDTSSCSVNPRISCIFIQIVTLNLLDQRTTNVLCCCRFGRRV